jgi:hypothetical protein
MKKDKKRAVVVLDVAERKISAYSDLTDAAGYLGIERSALDYRVNKEHVYYTGGCFVGWADIEPSNRGGNKGENQGFKS